MNCIDGVLSRIGIALVIAVSFACGRSLADDYPARPIVMVVPFAAGGPTDTLARIMAERMRDSLGQPIVVENITGAGGTLGVGRVARAAPDGYTIVIGAWNTHVVNGAIYRLAYDVLEDFEPIGLIANNYTLVVSNKSVPARSLSDLIGWVRSNQGKVSVGTGGVGTSAHIAAVLFEVITGIRFQLVPYRGAAPAEQELVAGHIDLMFDQASSALQYVQSGSTRAYAVAAPARLAAAPDIPTTEEAGLPGFQISVWHALWAPKGTPGDIVAKLNLAATHALDDPRVGQRLADISQDVPAAAQRTPGALRAYHKAEIEKWWPIIKAANLAVQ